MKKKHRHVGFTGTQLGMTDYQISQFVEVLKYLEPLTLHQGDCIGADDQANTIARELYIYTICHPPIKNSKRAFTECDEYMEPKDYLERNHDIVDESTVLISTPKGMEEELRSGTWATIRYARRTDKPVIIIWPTGGMTYNSSVFQLG